MLSSASPVSGNAEKRVRVRKVTVKSTGSEKWMRSTANDTQTAVLSALALLDFDACALPPPTTLEQLFGRGGGGGGAHPKVFECVAWFLVNQVGNGSGCVQVLKQAWPVLDRAHAREFRNGFAKALELLKKSGAFPQSLLIRRSCFDDCRGERFEQIMLALANLAVSTVMKREYADFIEPVPIKLLEKTSYTTEDYLSFMDKLPAKFESDVKEWDSQTKEWLDYGAELSDNFTKVLIEMDQLSKQRTELEEGAPLLDGVHYADFKSLRRVHQSKLETVRRFWADTLDWMDANAENIEIIDSVLENRANQHILDGTEARLEIPQDLSEHFRSRMQRDRIAPYAEDGALNLTSVAKLWQYSVEHVGMIFNAAGLYDDAVLNETYSTITKELEMATGIQESSIEVRKRLLAEKEHLLASIASLKMERKSRQDITSDSTTSALKKALNQPSLMLAPVTPKLHIRDRLKKGGKQPTNFKHPIVPESLVTATPEALANLRANVRAKLFDTSRRNETYQSPPAVAPAAENPAQSVSLRKSGKQGVHGRAPGSSPAEVMGKTPSKKGSNASLNSRSASPVLVVVPNSCAKAKPTQRYPLRKKASGTIQESDMLTSVVRPIHKIKSKPNLDMVEMTVDQIVQSVVKGAAPVPHSPFGAHAAAEKKSVRFHEEDSKSPLGAGVGFKPRAEIARTPLKMASAGSLSATPARTALLRQATTASAAAARQGSVSTSKKVSVRGTPLPVATAALRFRGTTCLKSPIISNRGLDETGESWLLDNVDEADTVNLLDEAVPVFMAERATIWEDGGGLEKAFEQQTTHRQEAVSVSTATTHPTTCAFDDFAPPSANKPLFLHSTVTRDDAAFGDASLSDGFEGASALDISMANPLEEMSFWQPPHDARHGSIGGNDISFLQAMEDEENLCSEGNPMLLGMNTNGAAESHIDDLAVFTLPPLPPSSNVSENDLEIPTDLVGIKSSADVVRVDTTTGAVFPQGKAAIDSHTDFEGLILPPLPPSCDVSGELFVEKEDVAGVKSECMAATSQPAFLDQARRKSLSDQRGIQAFLRVSDEPKGQNVAHEPEEFGEPSSLPSKSLDEGEVAVASIHISDLSLPPSISPQELIEPAVGKSLMDSFVAWKKDVSDAVLISDEAPLVNEGEERCPGAVDFEASVFNPIHPIADISSAGHSLQTFDGDAIMAGMMDAEEMPLAESVCAERVAPGDQSSLLSLPLVHQTSSSLSGTTPFRLDSGVAGGPNDLSEMVAGHPDPSSLEQAAPERSLADVGEMHGSQSNPSNPDVAFLKDSGSTGVLDEVNGILDESVDRNKSVLLEGFNEWDIAQGLQGGLLDTCEYLGDDEFEDEFIAEESAVEEALADISAAWLQKSVVDDTFELEDL